MTRHLITSALPYIDRIKHLAISSDRSCRRSQCATTLGMDTIVGW
jgi:hypothetical protein